MANENLAVVSEGVATTLEINDRHERFKLSGELEIKVADSDKCVSIYGITGRMPVNFTVEQFDALQGAWSEIQAYFEAVRPNLMTQAERKAEKAAAKRDVQIQKDHAKAGKAVLIAKLLAALEE